MKQCGGDSQWCRESKEREVVRAYEETSAEPWGMKPGHWFSYSGYTLV